MERRRFPVDRFRRIWAVVEYIAAYPGCSRRDLADRFALSERQLQADLDVIRRDMELPLVRRQGYRFQADDPPSPFDLADARALGLALRRAALDDTIAPEVALALARKLPALFPVHLRPLVERALLPPGATGERLGGGDVLAVVARAIERGLPVRLLYPDDRNPALLAEPLVDPELVIPY